MKKNKSHSIQRALFGPYTVLFIFIFTLIMGYFIFLESSKIKEGTFGSIKNSVSNISDTLDTEIQGLDTVSQNIMYSNLIKERFENYVNFNSNFSQSPSNLEQQHNNSQNTRVLYDMLIAIIGPNRPVDQINLYSLNNSKLGVGLDNSVQDISVKNMEWYQSVYDASGSKVLFCGPDPSLDKYSSSSKGSNYISLCRVYFSSLSIPQGIVELKLSFKKINQFINSINRLYDEGIYIYDSNGKLVYPFTNQSNTGDIYSEIKAAAANAQDNKSIDTIKTDNKYVLYKTSEYSNFTTAIVVTNEKLMSPIYNYIKTSVIIFFFVLLSVSLLSFTIAKRISKPLNKIYTEIKHFEITSDDNMDFSEIDTHITELNSLYRALQKMQRKAKGAMARELELQNREIQSKILALQSQMNPHFLYNTLSTIQAMADENMNDEIVAMCQSNARILRYISSNSEKLVPLAEELSCVKDYLNTMELRHEGKLMSKICIPDNMLPVEIPKLCLQLIVENAIKFTTKQKDFPWVIEITGHVDNNSWKISVTDNGPGFTENELSNIEEKISTIKQTGVYPNLELNGMGLMNVLIRLIILFKGKYIFQVENHDPHGAVITIGAYNINPEPAADRIISESGDDKA